MARQVVPRISSEHTRDKILSVAERLFAGAGFDGVSMREVGAEADVPFSLVTYHFKTKLGLYRAVFQRRSEQITKQRIDALRAIKLQKNRHTNFAAIARALVEPLMRVRLLEGGRDFGRLMAREVGDPVKENRGIVDQYFDPVAIVAIELLRKTCPQTPMSRIYWAYHFAIGALQINHADTGRLERLSGGICLSDNLDELIEELISFIAAGLLGSLTTERISRNF